MQVEIWSDVACPWCAIGKRRFEAALAEFPHRDAVDVRWRSFQLDPTAERVPTTSIADGLATKYGITPQRAEEMQAHVTRTAAQDGWEFRFDRARGGNTLDAHRLLHLAHEHGGAELQDTLKERLFQAYFTDGVAVGDPEQLADVAIDAGLPADDVRAVLGSDRFAADVRADQETARQFGVTGVPFFVLDRKFGVSGAQPVETLRAALDEAWAAANPLQVLTPAGATSGATTDAACADGSCAVPETAVPGTADTTATAAARRG